MMCVGCDGAFGVVSLGLGAMTWARALGSRLWTGMVRESLTPVRRSSESEPSMFSNFYFLLMCVFCAGTGHVHRFFYCSWPANFSLLCHLDRLRGTFFGMFFRLVWETKEGRWGAMVAVELADEVHRRRSFSRFFLSRQPLPRPELGQQQ